MLKQQLAAVMSWRNHPSLGPRVLVVRYAQKGEWTGLWHFPGGKVEVGELPRWAAARELKEEVGQVVEEHDLDAVDMLSVTTRSGKAADLYMFECTIQQHPVLAEPDKLDAMAYVTFNELKQLDMIPHIKDWLQRQKGGE